jgi:hypothetical protein
MRQAPMLLPPHIRAERDPLATIAVSAAPVVLEGRYRLLMRALWELRHSLRHSRRTRWGVGLGSAAFMLLLAFLAVRARVAPTDGHKSGLHRYCAGCAHETERLVWAADGRGSIPSIRWPSTEPAIGTTICLNCGQWRAASPQPRPPAWSSWPRKPTATRSLAVAADSTDITDDWVPEAAAENEGMPPRREPRRPRRSGARLRRAHAVAR